MREEINIWASKYTWEALSEKQRQTVLSSMTRDEYKQLATQLQALKTLEEPDSHLKAAILAKPQQKKKTGNVFFYVAGLAAMLVLGYFIGGLQFSPFQIEVNAIVAADTVYQKQTDTITLTQLDTVYKIKYRDRYITQQGNTPTPQKDEIPSPIDDNYKVPVPDDYTLEFPRMEKENVSIPIDIGPEEALPLTESIGRPQ